MNQKRGKLIVIEGMDGSGKNTQSELLVNYLNEHAITAKKVSFPNYESYSGKLVKKYLNGEYQDNYDDSSYTFTRQMSLFYAMDRMCTFIDRNNPEQKSLIDLLNSGTNIICDRYTTSNILHQSPKLKYLQEIDAYISWLKLVEYSFLGLPEPDMVIYLDINPSLSLHNIDKRGNVKDNHENLEHLKSVYEFAHYFVQKCGWKSISCYKNIQEMENPEIIQQQIQSLVIPIVIE